MSREAPPVQNVILPFPFSCQLNSWSVTVGSKVRKGTLLCTCIQNVGGGGGGGGEDGGEEEGGRGEETKLQIKSGVVGVVKELMFDGGGVMQPGAVVLVVEEKCQHDIVVFDMCADCGLNLRKHPTTSGSSPHSVAANLMIIHDNAGIRISQQEAEILAHKDKLRLLKTNKLTLVVDLDQTLIHTSIDANIEPGLPDVFEFCLPGHTTVYHCRLRPHLRHFLEKVSKLYELHVFTMATKDYAAAVVSHLDAGKHLFCDRIITRDEFFDPHSKALRFKSVFPCGDSMVAIIDDREDVWRRCPNLVHVKPYVFFAGTSDINAPPPTSISPSLPLPYTPTTPRPFFGQNQGGVVPQGQPKPFKMRDLTQKPRVAPQHPSRLVKHSQIIEERGTTSKNTERSAGLTPLKKLLVKDPEKQHAMMIESVQAPSLPESQNCIVNRAITEESTERELSSSDVEGETKRHASNLVSNNNCSNTSSNNNKERGEDGTVLPSGWERKDNVGVKDDKEEHDTCEGGEERGEDEMEGDQNASEKRGEGVKGPDCEEENVMGGSSSSSSSSGSGSEDSSSSSESDSGSSGMDATPCKKPTVPQTAEGGEEKGGEVEGGEVEGGQDELKKQDNVPKHAPAKQKEIKNTDCKPGSIDDESVGEQDKRGDIEDSDTFLIHLDNILQRIHSTFYSQFTAMTNNQELPSMSEIPTPDLKLIIPNMRQSVLKGTKILFTGVIPTNIPPQRSAIWNTARAFGAIIHDKLVPGLDSANPHKKMKATTHVIAGKPGTVKMKEARRMIGIKMVNPHWLWNCAEQWKWLEEGLFPVDAEKDCNKKNHKEFQKQENELKTNCKDSAFKDGSANESNSPIKMHDQDIITTQEKLGHNRLVSLESRLSVSDEELERMEAEVDAEIGSTSSSSSDDASQQDRGDNRGFEQDNHISSSREELIAVDPANNVCKGSSGRKRKHAEMEESSTSNSPCSNPDIYGQSDSSNSNNTDSEDELAALLEDSEANASFS